MATVTIWHDWPDGSTTGVEATVDDSFPDCVDEARATAVRAMTQTVAMLTTHDEED